MFRKKKSDSTWALVPASRNEIDAARRKCRSRIARHAAISAGASVVPIPGVDVAVDVVLLAKLINEVNKEFGLSPEQIARFLPESPAVPDQTIIGSHGVLAVQSVIRALLVQVLKRAGVEMVSMYTSRAIPFSRQIASAAVGFAAFRTIVDQHIEDCAAAAEEMIDLQAAKPVYAT